MQISCCSAKHDAAGNSPDCGSSPTSTPTAGQDDETDCAQGKVGTVRRIVLAAALLVLIVVAGLSNPDAQTFFRQDLSPLDLALRVPRSFKFALESG